MADSQATYFKVPSDGVGPERSDNSRIFKVGIAFIGGSCLVLLGMMAIYNSGSATATEATSLVGLPTSLRSMKTSVPAWQTMAKQLPGPSPWKELALAAIEDSNHCGWPGRPGRDVSTSAVRTALVSMAEGDLAKVEKVGQEIMEITKSSELQAGQSAPLGYFDPLGFSTKLSKGKLAFFREAEIKHGRVCMLASIGYLFGELWHPFFGGELDAPSYQLSQPQNFPETPALGTFWVVLFIVLGGFEGISSQTMAGIGEAKPDRIPGDLGFDPLDLKSSPAFDFLEYQNKELNNGRLAMMATVGMIGQEILTGKKLLFNLYN